MTVSKRTGRIAGRLADCWSVDGHQAQYSTYKHATETEPHRSSDYIALAARAATRTHEETMTDNTNLIPSDATEDQLAEHFEGRLACRAILTRWEES